jgi:hypothetical protein
VGPITSPVITNAITGDKLDFTGTTIVGGASYTIDCRYGQKTVVDSAGANQISKLTSDSDLSTFCLLPDPDAPGGANTLSASAGLPALLSVARVGTRCPRVSTSRRVSR